MRELFVFIKGSFALTSGEAGCGGSAWVAADRIPAIFQQERSL
jgi:hypothetical protein